MKAYIVCLEFVDLKPRVWRQVVLPYGATFHRLHETIQVVTNFSSTYGRAYHLYAFNLPQERLWITNEPKEEMRTGFSGQPWQVKNPSRIKIDSYLEKDGQLNYTYDFGDDWRLLIRLESVVDDYHFGYPTLLAGAGEAPPEDLGGPDMYPTFLERYLNPSHPGHAAALSFAKEQHFHLYDQSWINYCLKGVQWQKTQWDKIEHENYLVIRDPYRGPESQQSGQ